MTPLEQAMVPVYASLVKAGLRTLDSIPANLQAAVQAALE